MAHATIAEPPTSSQAIIRMAASSGLPEATIPSSASTPVGLLQSTARAISVTKLGHPGQNRDLRARNTKGPAIQTTVSEIPWVDAVAWVRDSAETAAELAATANHVAISPAPASGTSLWSMPPSQTSRTTTAAWRPGRLRSRSRPAAMAPSTISALVNRVVSSTSRLFLSRSRRCSGNQPSAHRSPAATPPRRSRQRAPLRIPRPRPPSDDPSRGGPRRSPSRRWPPRSGAPAPAVGERIAVSHRGDPLATEKRFERHPRIPGNCQRQLSYLEPLDVTCGASAMVRRRELGRDDFSPVMSGISSSWQCPHRTAGPHSGP